MRNVAGLAGLGASAVRRYSQLWTLSALIAVCAVFRWRQRLEPWSSDDMDLFQISASAATGQHWLFGTGPSGTLSHQALRIGLFPLSLPAIGAFGANQIAFYLVPLVFALLGVGLLYSIARQCFGPVVALGLGLIHIAWPFELQHASLFLTDLPSAVMGLACLYGIDRAARGAAPGPAGFRSVWVWLAGLAGLESQLLRNNTLVLLAPALLIFLVYRSTRGPTLRACAVALLGVVLLEALLAYRGLGWGYDWRRVHAALDEYAPFLPVYSWREFLFRQFDYQRRTFGHGVVGGLATALLVASLIGHGLLLAFERRALLLAITAFGLFSWIVFSFSIYERVPGGVRALAPPNYRYLQAFAYSSLLVWGWIVWLLRERVSRSRARLRAGELGAGALALLLVGFCCVALPFQPARYVGSFTAQLTQAIGRHVGAAPLRIAGISYSLAVPRLFCCASAGPVEWRELGPSELVDEVAHGAGTLVLRNLPRERSMARYFAPAEQAEYLRDLKRLEQELRDRAQLDYSDAKYALYRVPAAPVALAAR